MSHAEIVNAAAAALRRAWGAPVDLSLVDVIVDYAGAAAVLLRAELNNAPPGRPHTVIVKKSNTPAGVEMEWVGLAFLADLAPTRNLVPALLASDTPEKLLVMTDLADDGVQRIGDILFTDAARERAVEALIAAQAALGRLNAAGIGRQRGYDQIRARLNTARQSRHAVNRLDAMLAALPRVLSKYLRRSISTHVEDEILAARICLFEPGPFTTITHGDPTVGNLLYSRAHGVKFLDLETVEYRHALLDGSFARLRYLHSVWAHYIPIALQRKLETTYRTELANGCPQATDDLAFGKALIAACAAWLAALCSHLDRVTNDDVRWGRATYRQRIIAACDHFTAVGDEYGDMPALCDTVRHLGLHLRWPNTQQLPTYPALVEASQSEPDRNG